MRVSQYFLLVVVSVVWVAAAIKLAALSAIDPKRLLYDERGKEARFDSKPAKELMSANDFTAYDQALKRLDCDAASLVLNTSFLREYPQFKRARLEVNVAGTMTVAIGSSIRNVPSRTSGSVE